MGKSFVFAAASAAALGWVLPAFAEDKVPPAPIQVSIAGTPFTGELPVLDKVAPVTLTAGATPAASDPPTFSADAGVTKWVFGIAAKDFKELTGGALPADAKANAEKAYQAFKKAKVTHEGAGAPKGAIVFFKDRLVLSNGNGTCVGAALDGSGSMDASIPLSKLGDPLGWAACEASGGGGAAPAAPAQGGGGGNAAATGVGGAGGAVATTPIAGEGPVTTNGKLPAWLVPIMKRALETDKLPASWLTSAGLEEVLQHESSFSPTAQNPTSTAYGLFQFLDSTWATVGATKTSDAYLQCVAGLKYIAERYGNPDKAWAFHQIHNWY